MLKHYVVIILVLIIFLAIPVSAGETTYCGEVFLTLLPEGTVKVEQKLLLKILP